MVWKNLGSVPQQSHPDDTAGLRGVPEPLAHMMAILALHVTQVFLVPQSPASGEL